MCEKAPNQIGSVACEESMLGMERSAARWRNYGVPSIQLNRKGSARLSQDCCFMFSIICLADRARTSDNVFSEPYGAIVNSRELCAQPTAYRNVTKELTERLDEKHCQGMFESEPSWTVRGDIGVEYVHTGVQVGTFQPNRVDYYYYCDQLDEDACPGPLT